MLIKSAEFIVSNTNHKKCPSDNKPEYAFIGRSNVGKSSLINMLTNVKGLAKTSSKPGKTQLINHFLINNQWYIVDLPGYGYARTSKSSRTAWQKMISDYILHRKSLANVFLLIDSRIPPQNIDIEFANFLGSNAIPLTIVFTKTDKENQRTISGNINAFKNTLLKYWESLPSIILTSSLTGYGRDTVLDMIESINENLQQSSTNRQ